MSGPQKPVGTFYLNNPPKTKPFIFIRNCKKRHDRQIFHLFNVPWTHHVKKTNKKTKLYGMSQIKLPLFCIFNCLWFMAHGDCVTLHKKTRLSPLSRECRTFIVKLKASASKVCFGVQQVLTISNTRVNNEPYDDLNSREKVELNRAPFCSCKE